MLERVHRHVVQPRQPIDRAADSWQEWSPVYGIGPADETRQQWRGAESESPMFRPTSGLDSPRFVGIRTFMRLPYITDVSQCDAFVVGIPFDTGASYRVGSRFAPEAIRSISAMIRAYHPFHGFDIFDKISVADVGDLVVVPGYADSSLTRITNQLVNMLEQSN